MKNTKTQRIDKKIIVYDCKDKENDEVQNKDNHGYLPHPFRCAIIGKCGSGKSCITKNLCLQHYVEGFPFERIICFHYLAETTNEYDVLGDIELYAELPETLEELNLQSEKTLIILEDLDLKNGNKHQKSLLNRLFGCISSHMGVSIIATCQEVIQLPVSVRRMINYCCIFKITNPDDLTMLIRKTGMKASDCRYIFEHICNEPHDCIMISYDSKPILRKNLFEEITGFD